MQQAATLCCSLAHCPSVRPPSSVCGQGGWEGARRAHSPEAAVAYPQSCSSFLDRLFTVLSAPPSGAGATSVRAPPTHPCLSLGRSHPVLPCLGNLHTLFYTMYSFKSGRGVSNRAYTQECSSTHREDRGPRAQCEQRRSPPRSWQSPALLQHSPHTELLASAAAG